MEVTPETGRKPNRTLRRILMPLATAVLAALALLIFAFRDRLSAEGLQSMFVRRETQASAEAFIYEPGSSQVFAAAGNGLAVAGSSSLQLFDGAGNSVFQKVVSYGAPAVFASGSGAMFCDIGGAGCEMVTAAGEAVSPEVRGDILTAHRNGDGWTVLVTEVSGYKALVCVYAPGGDLRYEWWSGAGYVLKACVGPDNRTLAVLCAEPGGGKLHLFRLDSAEPLAEAEFPDELPFDFCFLGSGALCVLDGSVLRFLSSDGSEKSRYVLGDNALTDYDLGGDGFVAVLAGGQLLSFDRDGTLLGNVETGRDVISLSACGRQLLVMTAAGLTVYERNLTPRYSVEAVFAAKTALLRADGDILLPGVSGAERVTPGG